MEEQIANAQIIDKKCYNCGKVFKLVSDLTRHKNRKTPCLIREVAPEQVNNPNRCIFCNRIFTNIGNKNKHLKICNIKNGGMNILADKVRYEQEIRILKEQRELDRRNHEIEKQKNELLAKRLDENDKINAHLLSEIEELKKKTVTPTINNTTNIGTINNTFVVNNYMKPDIKHLLAGESNDRAFTKIFRKELVGTPMALIPQIWFNPAHPENYSIYLVNKSTKETLAYDGETWNVTTADIAARKIREHAYKLTNGIISKDKSLINQHNSHIPGNIQTNMVDEELIKIDCVEIFGLFSQNRNLVKPYLPAGTV